MCTKVPTVEVLPFSGFRFCVRNRINRPIQKVDASCVLTLLKLNFDVNTTHILTGVLKSINIVNM